MPRITIDAARAFFAHPSQHLLITPENLPGEGFEYWAQGPICAVFHLAPWPGVWMAHYGAKPEGWGHLTEPARAVLREFWGARQPERIIGWTHETNRAALAFARRIGFERDGEMHLPSGKIITQGWRK